MRSLTRAYLTTLSLMMAGLLPLALPLPAYAGEDGYRLLELDGYKVKWGEQRLGVGASISYAFAGETLRFEGARNCGELAPIATLLGENISMETLAHETAAAFRVWELAAGLSFHEVDNVREANIVFGAQGRPRGQAFANVSYGPEPVEGVRAIEQALVCLNPDHKWKVGFDGDEGVYDIRYTLIHEIGHAIGLDHPGPSGQVMAFRYTEAFEDLQPGDLLGVQLLYGPAVNAGSTPGNGFETAQVTEPGENEEVGSISDLIIYQDSSNAAVIADGLPDMDEQQVVLSQGSVELAEDADQDI